MAWVVERRERWDYDYVTCSIEVVAALKSSKIKGEAQP